MTSITAKKAADVSDIHVDNTQLNKPKGDSIPIKECSDKGKKGWKYGDSGKCYVHDGTEADSKRAKKLAINQALAINEGKAPADLGKEDLDKEHTSEYLVAFRKCTMDEPSIMPYTKDKIHKSARGMAGGKISGQSRQMLLEAGTPEETLDAILEDASEDVEKGGFANPFSGNANKLNKNDLIRALRLDIASEYEAVTTYTAHADSTSDPIVKKVLQTIAEEEIKHIGEFQKLIGVLTGHEECQLISEGKDELDDVLGTPEPGDDVHKSIQVDILKYEPEKGLIYGAVLIPAIADLQGDIISAEEIEKACHDYLVKSRTIFKQHKEKTSDAVVVESYIYRPLAIPEGSWILVTKLLSEELKTAVKKGEIRGYSIGGKGSRTPV